MKTDKQGWSEVNAKPQASQKEAKVFLLPIFSRSPHWCHVCMSLYDLSWVEKTHPRFSQHPGRHTACIMGCPAHMQPFKTALSRSGVHCSLHPLLRSAHFFQASDYCTETQNSPYSPRFGAKRKTAT